VVSNHPGSTVLLVGSQHGDGRWFIICNRSHAQVSERRTGGSLKLPNSRQVLPASGSHHDFSYRLHE
jgi:hypothetical protein